MAQHINLFDEIEDFQRDLIECEGMYDNIQALNKDSKNNDCTILYINVRSLNSNFNKLEIFLERLKSKPYVIVCSESWDIKNKKEFKLDGYKDLYYNESKLNKADGVAVFVKNNLKEITETLNFGNLKLLNTTVTLNDNSILTITSLYRSHDFPRSEFNMNLSHFLNKTKNNKNHLIIGDFNIDILKQNDYSEQLLNNLLEKGFRPGFIDITRPANEEGPGSCIDNIYIKNSSIETRTYKLTIPFNDHYPLFINLKNKLN